MPIKIDTFRMLPVSISELQEPPPGSQEADAQLFAIKGWQNMLIYMPLEKLGIDLPDIAMVSELQ
jgi:hypothetical protein